ncbi:MAG: hypothetical protein HY235_23015 [Acidobacteria bacterium]|nr:hypothetical protein [Acidobacteriota bacterium]
MAKYEVTKSVEAVKLNKRTGIPLTEPPITIPFGAIIDNLEESGDYYKFHYLTDRYQFRIESVQGALQPLGGPEKAAADAPATAAVPMSAEAPAAASLIPLLLFEPLAVRGSGPMARARVPGGWMVTGAGSLTFVPDPKHTWDGGSED